MSLRSAEPAFAQHRHSLSTLALFWGWLHPPLVGRMAETEATPHFKNERRRNLMNLGIVELALIAVIGLVALVIVLAVIVFIIRKSK